MSASPSRPSLPPQRGVDRFDAAIFDMDGLLLESESLWRQAEEEVSGALGLGLTTEHFESTMGVRMHDVARQWFEWSPWDGPSTDVVADQVIDRVIELVGGATPLPGVEAAIEAVASAGLAVALCSSSSTRLIDAALGALHLHDRFSVVHSAENDEFGKPHPEPYLVTARLLGVDPTRCVAFEDSVAGCLSAKAASMTVIAVPDPAQRGTARFGFADVVLESMIDFDNEIFDGLAAGRVAPTLSRPRFHLAIPVDDLGSARHFYGDVLGCREGRSASTWIDFDLWGHQLVAHLDSSMASSTTKVATNEVDGHDVPASHFGCLLNVPAWRSLADRLRGASIPFLMEPTTRFAGEAGEQHTMFVLDPAGNALEFKAFADDRQTFAVDALS